MMVTDQPFWRVESGAHQRIDSLVRQLLESGFELRVFLMVPRTPADVEICDRLDCVMVEYDPAPELVHKFYNWTRRLIVGESLQPRANAGVCAEASSPAGAATRLADYQWPHADRQFRDLVADFRPDVLLFEYITYHHLLRADYPNKARIRTVVDTHDALHVRHQKFREQGKQHWLEISRDEEAAALAQFDLILAIQSHEARCFREMSPRNRVMVVGHVPGAARHLADAANRGLGNEIASSAPEAEVVRIGFIGSSNAPNEDGLRWFLSNCWGDILQASSGAAALVLAGPWESRLSDLSTGPLRQIEWLGPVKDIRTFYERVDLVINPVRYGSGLKIKTVESFCFGKPMVATGHAVGGLSETARELTCLAETAPDFVAACVKLIQSPELLRQRSCQIRQLAEREFSAQAVYAELIDWLTRQKAD